MKGIYVNQFFIFVNVSLASFLCLLIFSYKGGEKSYKRHLLQPILSGSAKLLLLSSYHKAGTNQSITSALRLSMSLLLDASSPSSSHQHILDLKLPSSWTQDLCICHMPTLSSTVSTALCTRCRYCTC